MNLPTCPIGDPLCACQMPSHNREVVVEVFGGVARVAQPAPGVTVRIVDYTADGELIAHAGEVVR
jgi:hypothetical protein